VRFKGANYQTQRSTQNKKLSRIGRDEYFRSPLNPTDKKA